MKRLKSFLFALLLTFSAGASAGPYFDMCITYSGPPLTRIYYMRCYYGYTSSEDVYTWQKLRAWCQQTAPFIATPVASGWKVLTSTPWVVGQLSASYGACLEYRAWRVLLEMWRWVPPDSSSPDDMIIDDTTHMFPCYL